MIFSPLLTTIVFVQLISIGNAKSSKIIFSLIRISCVIIMFLAVLDAAIYLAFVVNRETSICLANL